MGRRRSTCAEQLSGTESQACTFTIPGGFAHGVADMDVIMGAIRRKEMAHDMEYDGVPGQTLVMLVEERPLSGLGHRAASALDVLALVSETRATSTTGLSGARFVPDCLEPVASALAVSQFLPCGPTHDAAERGQCRERPTPGRRAGWTCRARFSTGSVLKVWPSWFSAWTRATT